jgi:iron uptake system EfeUOB component EfeO/EfeM
MLISLNKLLKVVPDQKFQGERSIAWQVEQLYSINDLRRWNANVEDAKIIHQAMADELATCIN